MKHEIEIHTCQCGFTWQHGLSGSHDCEPYYRKQIDELNKQVVNLAVENAELKGAVIAWSERELAAATPATDATLASIQAQGVDIGIAHLLKKFEGTGQIGVPVMALEWLAAQLRKGVAA